MSNFWDMEGEKLNTTGAYRLGGDGFKLIPDNTNCIALIDKAEWQEYQGNEYINVKWLVTSPEEYKGRVVFQKLKVFDEDAKRARKAKHMLAAIDVNAGGKLSKLKTAPSPIQLHSLNNAKMMIKVFVWEIDDKSGNWVGGVSPAPIKREESVSTIEETDFEDDVPF